MGFLFSCPDKCNLICAIFYGTSKVDSEITQAAVKDSLPKDLADRQKTVGANSAVSMLAGRRLMQLSFSALSMKYSVMKLYWAFFQMMSR